MTMLCLIGQPENVFQNLVRVVVQGQRMIMITLKRADLAQCLPRAVTVLG